MIRPGDKPGASSSAGKAESAPPALHEQLRQKRLAAGLDLEALSRETKIQRRYFEAIEAGQVHLLPQGVYMRNFIRIYLRALGIDNPAELQTTIDSLTNGILRLPMVSALPPSHKRQAEMMQAWNSAILLGAAVALAGIGWLLWHFVIRGNPTTTPVVATSPTPLTTPPPRLQIPPTATIPSPTPIPASANLIFTALRRASLVVKAQSGTETPMTLQRSESVTLHINEPVVVEVGSAGSVAISVDGQDIPLSRLRSSRTVSIDPDNLDPLFEENAPSPTTTAKSRRTPKPTTEDGSGEEASEGEATPTRRPRRATPEASGDSSGEAKPTRRPRNTATPKPSSGSGSGQSGENR